MLSKTMADALNEQVKHELYSSNLYLAMSSWCEGASLTGYAKWLRVQVEEERGHAMKLFDYLLDHGAAAMVPALAAPSATWRSALDLFHQVVEHEKGVTARINKLMELAIHEADFATQEALHWFVKEQIEEEKNASLLAAHLEMVGEKSAAILNLDHNAGKRGK